jgi:hypothetical protein
MDERTNKIMVLQSWTAEVFLIFTSGKPPTAWNQGLSEYNLPAI